MLPFIRYYFTFMLKKKTKSLLKKKTMNKKKEICKPFHFGRSHKDQFSNKTIHLDIDNIFHVFFISFRTTLFRRLRIKENT